MIWVAIVGVICILYAGEEDEWWYFWSAIIGGLTSIITITCVASLVTSANYKATFKARLTVIFSYKVAHRCGIAVTYLTLGICITTLHCLFGYYRSNFSFV